MDEIDLLTSLPGLRDFFPADWAEVEYILTKMREVAKSYGYTEYEGPGLEMVELIEAKSGEGLMREIFKLRDRNDRSLLLRPEQTPTLARMLAKEQQRFKRPIRWFSIPRIFRDETVQKGRLREFWQLNVDILGEDSTPADAETLAVAIDILRACGLQDEEFVVYVNHRGLLGNFIGEICDIPPEKVIPLVDKKMMFLQDRVQSLLEGEGMAKTEAEENALLFRRIINSSGDYRNNLLAEASDDLRTYLSNVDVMVQEVMIEQYKGVGLDHNQAEQLVQLTSLADTPTSFVERIQDLDLPDSCQKAVTELAELETYLTAYGVANPVIFDASMARGLDYYTGIVYEAFDATGEVVRSIFGGGRYSDLVEVIGGNPLSGVGFGMGDPVLLELMKLRDAFPKTIYQSPQIYLAPIKDEPIPTLIKLSQRLKTTFSVICNPFSWRLKRHFEQADALGAELVILLGARDLSNNVVSVRVMKSGDQLQLDFDETLEQELQQILTSEDQ